MKKLTLTRTYIHGGKFYGPGAVELDDAVAADLAERESALRPALAPEPTGTTAPAKKSAAATRSTTRKKG